MIENMYSISTQEAGWERECESLAKQRRAFALRDVAEDLQRGFCLSICTKYQMQLNWDVNTAIFTRLN